MTRSAVLTACLGAIALWMATAGGIAMVVPHLPPLSVGMGAAVVAAALVILVSLLAVAVTRPVEFFLTSWVVFVLQEPLRGYAASVSHQAGVVVGRIDDATLVLMLAALGIRRLSGEEGVIGTRMRAGLIAISIGCLGIGSAVVHSDVGPWTFVGAWLSLKFWVVLFIAMQLPWKPRDVDRAQRLVLLVAVVVGFLGVVDYVSPGFVTAVLHTKPIEVDPNELSRAHATQSVFTSPSRYSNFMSLAVAVSLARYAVTNKKIELVLAFSFAVAGLASLRLRGLFALAASAIVLIASLRERRLVRVTQFGVVVGLSIFIVGASAFTAQFTKFTSTPDQTARGKLYSNAAHLTFKSFPLGVGFGRYGSYASVLYYSPYYDRLNMSDYYGFSREFPHYLTDTSWSGYFAETGVSGAGVFIFGLALIAMRLLGEIRRRPTTASITSMSVLAAIIAMSIGSAALMDSVLLTGLGMFLGPAFCAMRNTASEFDVR